LTERVKEERRRGRRSAQAWLDAFVVGTDGALYHKWWAGCPGPPRPPGTSTWAASSTS